MMNLKGMVLVSEATASTSATIDFTGLEAGYDYVIRYRDLVPSTNASIYLRVGTGGTPTYQTGGSDYCYARQYNQVTGSGNDPSASSDKIAMAFAVTDNNKNSCGEITLFNPAGTTLLKAIKYHCSYISTFGATYDASNINGSGFYRGATTAVTALRIYLSTGTINSGKFSLYKIPIS